MNESMKCRTCGIEIPLDTPLGQCPKCLFGLGVAAADEPAPARAPRCFAGYELVRQIGCGGMGVVYEARQPNLNRTVALKMILGGETCSPVMRRRFFIEAEAAARLDHPNIVPIYEVGEFEDNPFLSMKLVHGESLRKKMVHGELGLPKDGKGLSKSAVTEGERTIARLIATLARAVHHAHTHNVVHRDLKPGNILFDANNTPHVTDFGLAKILDPDRSELSAPTEIIGTLAYMSPQQVRAEPVTPVTDIYSLGVILYELLAGQLPFHGTTRNETLQLIETEPPTRLKSRNRHIHKDLETICLKCLEKDNGNRYATAEALANDLDSWLANQSIKARPAGPFLRSGRWIKRNPLATALIVTLTLAFMAAVWFLPQIREKIKLEEENKRLYIEKIEKDIKDGWAKSDVTSVVIPAEALASLQRHARPDTNGAIRLTLAFNMPVKPVIQANRLGPLLENLQKRMRSLLGRPVLLNLMLCKYSYQSFTEIADDQPREKKPDFQRLGAVGYVRALNLNAKVQAVVQEESGKDAVIFVRKSSPITILDQFADHSFVFGDTNSTIVAWAKVYLVRRGIRGTNLSDYKTIDDTMPLAGKNLGDMSVRSGGMESPVFVSGWAAAQQVLPQFLPNDLPGLSNLVQKLRSGSDPVSQYLWNRFQPTNQLVLMDAKATLDRQQDPLKEELDGVVQGKSIFDPQRFADVRLSPETLRLLAQNPQGDDLIRLNWLLLQDAYPLEIAKRRLFDGAVLQEIYFEQLKLKEPNLREVYPFNITPNVYVARAGLAPEVKRAFQKAMLSIKDPALLEALPSKPPIERFLQPDTNSFNLLRAAMTNEVLQFEGVKP